MNRVGIDLAVLVSCQVFFFVRRAVNVEIRLCIKSVISSRSDLMVREKPESFSSHLLREISPNNCYWAAVRSGHWLRFSAFENAEMLAYRQMYGSQHGVGVL